MCLLKCMGKLLLVVLNLTFLMVSVGLISTGVIILKFFDRVLGRYVNPTFDSLKTDINTLHGITIEENKDYLEKIYSHFAIILIVTGVILFFLSLFGFVGSCCRVKKLLHIYALMLIGLIVVQVVVVCLFIWKRDVMIKGIRTPLKDAIDKYQGTNGTNGETWAWNFLMRQYECCGIDDYTDFQAVNTWWEKANHVTPYMCCKDFPANSTEGSTCAGASSTASVSTIADKNNYNTGCLNKAWKSLILDHAGYVIIALFAFFCFQVLMVVFSCVLYHDDDDDDDGKSRNQPKNKRKARKPRKPRRVAPAEEENW